MKIQQKPMGDYLTNCYIVTIDNQDLIIDPGVGSFEWVKKHAKNPIAILNTHGHFDHVWCNNNLQKEFNIPIYIHKKDSFLLTDDPFGKSPKSSPDFEIEGDEKELTIDKINIKYVLYAGHTPGCCAIFIEDAMFSGDFIFKDSIGRTDFPFSSSEDMKKSLSKFKELSFDMVVYPGHGGRTTIKHEQNNVDFWLGRL